MLDLRYEIPMRVAELRANQSRQLFNRRSISGPKTGGRRCASDRVRVALTAVLLALSCSSALAENLSGQASIIDGDTLEIHGTRIRLWG